METTLVKTFENSDFGKVRVVMIKGEPWFVAKDVCDALELVKTDRALARLDDDEKDTHLVSTLGGMQQMSIVNEFGLYNLILGSRKKEAKQFKRWVTHEVLPSIRKTGSYNVKPMTQAEQLLQSAMMLVEQERQIMALKESENKQNLRLTAVEQEFANPFSKTKQKERTQDIQLQSHEERITDLETILDDKGPAEEIKSVISAVCKTYDMSYPEAYINFYRYLKDEYGINVSARLTALKKRKEEQGMSKSRMNNLGMLDAIIADPSIWEKVRDAIAVIRQNI